MAAATAHVLPEASAVHEGRLSIGGCDCEALAREHGTPAYVVAEDDLRARARAFTAALAGHHDGPGEVVFASKAFPCTAALRVFAQEGLGCDVASGGELHLALRAGFAPGRLYLHGNAKSEAELRMALDAGVGTIVLDNAEEAQRLAALLGGARRQRVLVRVIARGRRRHPRGDPHRPGGLQVRLRARRGARAGGRRRTALEVAGLHMHLGSQLFALEPYRRAVRALAGLGAFAVYDLGGGLGVPYTRGDPALDVEAWVAGVVEAAHAELGPDRALVLEPGRALVAGAGVTLYTRRGGQAGRRGRAAGRRRWRHVATTCARCSTARATRPSSPTRFGADGVHCTVVGKHCESGDVLVRDARLADPRAGDVLVTPVTGAYGHAMANNYNGAPRPPVVFCSGGRARVVVRRETYEDLHGRDL